MLLYILKRIALIFPTLFFIILINFFIVQLAPGGPVENLVAKLKNPQLSGGADAAKASFSNAENYAVSRGLDPELISEIQKMYGFDLPPTERFLKMLYNYASFDLGESYFKNSKVTDLIKQKIPVSVSLGLWSTILIYLISIPLGIRKACKHGTSFDLYSSFVLIISYSIPSFLLAICLIMLFGMHGVIPVFPIRGLTSYNWDELSFTMKIYDYIWHIILPVATLTISGFATITLLTKNSFLEEISKQYILTARAKGLSEESILYKHVFRNAMLIVISGIPEIIVKIFFTGTLLIEIIFSLDGLGLLGYEAAVNRDYPLVFGSLYLFTLIGLIISVITDITYVLVDPRINFDSK